jgi:hypothetical protein
MQDTAICTFAWDFIDEGIEPVLRFAADSGLTSLFFASTYHAGWFVLPHNPRRTCYMVEDGVTYFHPSPRFFDATVLKPRVSQIAAGDDWLAKICEQLGRHSLRMTAWTVCLHNSPMGLAYPEHTVVNALGDSYPHALTPGSAEVRNYVRGLATNLASQYPIQSIFLEAVTYGHRKHGHHHARDLITFGPLEEELLDISFSPHDVSLAEKAGIDARSVRLIVATHLKSYLANTPIRPRGMPTSSEEFNEICPLLAPYRQLLLSNVATLIDEIRSDVEPYGVKLEGVDPSGAFDWQISCAYGKNDVQTAEIVREERRIARNNQRIRVGLRLGADPSDSPGSISCADSCRNCVAAAANNGADGLYFYNYSESPGAYLSWVKPALAALN